MLLMSINESYDRFASLSKSHKKSMKYNAVTKSTGVEAPLSSPGINGAPDCAVDVPKDSSAQRKTPGPFPYAFGAGAFTLATFARSRAKACSDSFASH